MAYEIMVNAWNGDYEHHFTYGEADKAEVDKDFVMLCQKYPLDEVALHDINEGVTLKTRARMVTL